MTRNRSLQETPRWSVTWWPVPPPGAPSERLPRLLHLSPGTCFAAGSGNVPALPSSDPDSLVPVRSHFPPSPSQLQFPRDPALRPAPWSSRVRDPWGFAPSSHGVADLLLVQRVPGFTAGATSVLLPLGSPRPGGSSPPEAPAGARLQAIAGSAGRVGSRLWEARSTA